MVKGKKRIIYIAVLILISALIIFMIKAENITKFFVANPYYAFENCSASADITNLSGINVKGYKCTDGQYVKGDGVHDDTTGIQAAIKAAYASITTVSKNVFVIFPAGKYKVTGHLTMSSQCHLVSKGIVEIDDYGCDLETLLITPGANDIPYYQEHFFQPAIYGSFRLNNATGDKTYKSGIRIHSVEGAIDVNCSFNGVFLEGYRTGVLCESINTYLMDFKNMKFSDDTIGFQFGNGIEINAGEKISIWDSVFTNCDCCINAASEAELFFYNTSFDFNYCVVYGEIKVPRMISFDGCWIEGVGYGWANGAGVNGNWNGFSGIVKVPDSAEWYDNCFVYLTHTRILHSHATYQAPYFSGSTLSIVLDNSVIWFVEEFYRAETLTGDLTKAFLCDDTVRKFDIKNADQTLTSAPWPQSKMSVIDPYFTKDKSATLSKTVGDVGLSEYTLDTINEVETWEVGTVDGRQCIGLTPSGRGSTTYVWLLSKKKYRIKGENFKVTAFIKGYKTVNNTYVNFNIQFYDANNVLISDTPIADTYRSGDTDQTVIPSDKWIIPITNKTYSSIPANALYYRIKVRLLANDGSSNINKVYFTGIHVFNY